MAHWNARVVSNSSGCRRRTLPLGSTHHTPPDAPRLDRGTLPGWVEGRGRVHLRGGVHLDGWGGGGGAVDGSRRTHRPPPPPREARGRERERERETGRDPEREDSLSFSCPSHAIQGRETKVCVCGSVPSIDPEAGATCDRPGDEEGGLDHLFSIHEEVGTEVTREAEEAEGMEPHVDGRVAQGTRATKPIGRDRHEDPCRSTHARWKERSQNPNRPSCMS